MRANPIPLTGICLFISLFTLSQENSPYKVLLKSGTITPAKNITTEFTGRFNSNNVKSEGQNFAIIQFEHIPTESERQQLASSGIELLEYIPEHAYTVSIKKGLDRNILLQTKALSVIELSPKQKMIPPLNNGEIPVWSTKAPGTVDVLISYYKTLSFGSVSLELLQKNFDIVSSEYRNYNIVALRVPLQRLNELAAMPFVESVQPAPPPDQELNYNSKKGARANVLHAAAANGGYDLSGEGVVIGIGDNADPLRHIDFAGRVINRNVSVAGAHGLHVTGIAGGGGIIDERYSGYAPKAILLGQSFSGAFLNAPAYVQDYGMVITNNSYGGVTGDCSYNGLYDLYSRILDIQAFTFPNLQNVFAVGNSGAGSCAPYPAGFRTVLGSYQAAKNIIAVGNTTSDGTIITASSKGPVTDGRTKPEISAMGTDVISTWPIDTYVQTTGTSMASPAVAGGLALLYQRYRQMNGGANPKNALMKALICNGGTDKGNIGPDYSYGFGWLNLLRSIDMLNNNRWFNSTVANAVTNNHTIAVPANTAQLKVMLYWNDPAANVLATHTLVNDLDLEVVRPTPGPVVLPALLDTLAANVNNPANPGVDRINNIEQIVINAPAAGNYTANVRGFAVTQAPPQEYFLVYDIIPNSTVLTYPIGGEGLVPGETFTVQWDSYGNTSNTFTLQYSTNNGTSWIDVNTSIAATARQFSWTVPSVITDQALVRILKNGTSEVSTSQALTILGRPVVTASPVQCEGYFSINWAAITGATDYEVMMLRGNAMASVDIVPAGTTNYIFNGLSKDTVYWVGVRARLNGKPGYRSYGISRQPNNGSCTGTISSRDIKLDAILAPRSGRLLTSTALGAATTVTARMKNLDDSTITNFDMKYSVNGGAWVTENVTTSVAAGATYTHNFAATYNFSAAGTYTLQVVVKLTGATDPVPVNDTITVVIKQLNNPAITISVGSDFIDNIESGTVQEHTTPQIGLNGLDRYDFVNSTVFGRVRTFINTGIARSGNRAITLDADRTGVGSNIDSLTGTFNLDTYTTAANDVRLDFYFKHHGQLSNAANKVWIRGNDQQPWIEAYDLDDNQEEDPGIYKKSESIELSDLLAANSQNFSTSFQVRWGQWGQSLAADNDGAAGYTFDDIRVYMVTDDIQLISIDNPIASGCALTASTPITITVRNSVNTTVTNIPIRYRIDGSPTVIMDTIPSIPGNTAIQYTFDINADLSALGTHTIEAWVDYATDSYPDNDADTITIVNSPVISTFPYLENFETSNGYWYANGKKSTWEYGTPASNKIRTAASGTKAWKTTLTGNYNDMEFSYLYSPCFNIAGMTNPTLSFSLALDIEDCGASSYCDGAWVEYSADGITWTKLGTNGTGTNWYNRNYSGNHLWSVQNYTRWHVATNTLPTGLTNLRLRFVIQSDPAVNREGIAVDDIHIYDNTLGIYDGVTMGAPVNQNIAGGTSWINFTSGGKLVAAVQPNNQNMGSTDVRAYINTGTVRRTPSQYYHDRNITIIPSNIALTDSVLVRFYFLDTETEALINATGCGTCTKPASAYELGVSKFTDPANRSTENGTIIDDNGGTWLFIPPARAVKVPFDKGYYAEFKVKDFSEFWLNNGWFTGSVPLPVKLTSFTAQKQRNNDVLVKWKTADEFDINHYELEVARSTAEYQAGHFVKLADIASQGNAPSHDYQFIDQENNKAGVRYYRLRIVENSGSFTYSLIRPVMFNEEIKWQVYPNPSNGLFNFVYQQNPGETVNVRVHDISGKLIYESQHVADGFVQKLMIDLRMSKYTPGLYMITAEGSKKQVFKVIKR